jgi:hypothetical protein
LEELFNEFFSAKNALSTRQLWAYFSENGALGGPNEINAPEINFEYTASVIFFRPKDPFPR